MNNEIFDIEVIDVSTQSIKVLSATIRIQFKGRSHRVRKLTFKNASPILFLKDIEKLFQGCMLRVFLPPDAFFELIKTDDGMIHIHIQPSSLELSWNYSIKDERGENVKQFLKDISLKSLELENDNNFGNGNMSKDARIKMVDSYLSEAYFDPLIIGGKLVFKPMNFGTSIDSNHFLNVIKKFTNSFIDKCPDLPIDEKQELLSLLDEKMHIIDEIEKSLN